MAHLVETEHCPRIAKSIVKGACVLGEMLGRPGEQSHGGAHGECAGEAVPSYALDARIVRYRPRRVEPYNRLGIGRG